VSAKSEKKSSGDDIALMSFEQAMTSLEEIVRRLESGQISLEESIKDYALGTALKSHCMQKISDAKLKVEKILSAPDGKILTEKFTTEE
jgi:exodeoxyribonuclease VII small subunit